MSALSPTTTTNNSEFSIVNGKVEYNNKVDEYFDAYPVIVGNKGWFQTQKFTYKPGQLFMEALIVGVSFALFNGLVYWSLEKIITRWFGKPKSYKLMRIMILITISSFLSAAALHLLFELFGINRYYILNYFSYPKNTISAILVPGISSSHALTQ